ncbi:hypothetical protein OC861_006451 [Tilletia horrida]|nr:hypothetical protein OC861_006451 [Tilletia horrida]
MLTGSDFLPAGIEGIDSGGLCPNPGALTPPYLTTTTSAGVGLFGTQRSQASAAGAAGTSDHAMMGTAGIVLSTPMARTRPTHTGGSPGFSFGASNNNAAKPGNLFGQTFGTPAPATESFGVGATSSAATGQTSPSFSFGNTAASTSAPSAFGVVGQAPPAAGSHPPGHLRGLLNGGVNMEASSSQLVTGMLGAFGPHAFNAVEQASEMGDDNDDSYEDGAVGLEEPDTASAKSNPTAHIDGVGSITASERPGIYPDRGRVLIRNFFSRATQQQWDQAAEIANTGETTIGANCPMCWNGVREPLRALCPPKPTSTPMLQHTTKIENGFINADSVRRHFSRAVI